MRESEEIEFKETTKELKQAVISMSAMLNKHGHGTVFFGIDNSGHPCRRMMIGENTSRDVSVMVRDNLRPMVTPTISIEEYEGCNVIKAEVEGADRPYSAFGRYYIRSDDEDLILDPTQLRTLFKRTNNTQNVWEQQSSGHGIDCVDESRLIDYINQCNDTGRLDYVYRDIITTLSKLGLMFDKTYLNNAGYYLLSVNKPLRLKLAIFNTDERLSFSDIKQIDGNIFECIDEGIKYIKSNMRWSAKIIDQKRVETPEIPVEAIREIVINSFAHMKYNVQPYNEIFFTPERLSVFNPGRLPEGTTPQTFADGSAPSILRNPIIANVLYLNKSIDAFGTGFHRVFVACSSNGIKYEYSQNDFGFTFQFIRKHTADEVHMDSLSQDEITVLNLISNDPTITIDRLRDATGLTRTAVTSALNRLKSRGILIREGARKNGIWRIIR